MFGSARTNQNSEKRLQCAIYTRKSHIDGLEQEFNSLDAQRESAEAYIKSQKMLGWEVLPDRYDDGGFSGGTMERPALQKLLSDIDSNKVDVIVVYKLDRLSRSLIDFTRMIEAFNEKEVSFVSVTQQISTTDSTGRMMLNTLMTFAQYEREVIGERIRDKVSAAKRKGKYCGGTPPIGYNVNRDTKKLEVNEDEAELVRFIFKRYTQLGGAKQLAMELNEQGYKTKSWAAKNGNVHRGGKWNTGHIYRALKNRLYIGEIEYKGENYEGEHEAIIDKVLWDKVQGMLKENTVAKISKSKTKSISPLHGVIRCGHCGGAMGITYSQKGPRRYTYYLCRRDAKRAVSVCPIKRVSAGDIEKVVLQQLAAVFRTPTLVSKTYSMSKEMEKAECKRIMKQKEELESAQQKIRTQVRELLSPDCTDAERDSKLHEANRQMLELAPQIANVSKQLKALKEKRLTESNISKTFQSIEMFWEDLFPLERHRLIQLLVELITIKEDGIDIDLKTNGLTTLVSELATSAPFDLTRSASPNASIVCQSGATENRHRRAPMNNNPEISMTKSGNLHIHVPMLIRRQQGRKIIIAPKALDGDVPGAPEVTQNAIVQALIRAFSWKEALADGKVKSVSDLARELDVDSSYVARILRLTTLAPDIVEAIINGEEPNGLSLAKLVKPFPENWKEQRKWFCVTGKTISLSLA